MGTHLSMRGWASAEQLTQIAKDYRAAVDLIDSESWNKHGSDDGQGLNVAQALGVIIGAGGDSFAGRASLALSACFRVTGLLLNQVNDSCQNWADLKSILTDIADKCDKAALVTGTTHV